MAEFQAQPETARSATAGSDVPLPCAPESSLIDLLTVIGDIITTSADPDEALDRILQRAVRALNADQGSLMLFDERDPNTLVITKATGLPPEVVRTARVRVGQGIAGFVALRGETVAIRKGERHPLSQSSAGATETASLSLPLRVRNATVGVLNVRAVPVKEAYTQAEIQAACVVASQVATTVDVARLLHSLNQRIDDAQRELVESNRLLAQARRQTQEILESVPSPVIVVDADGLVLLVNRATERTFGLSRTQMLSRRISDALGDKEIGDTLDQALARLGQEGAPSELAVGPPVNRVFAIHVAELPREEADLGGARVIALSDVTELKELSELKSQLVSDTSHELRNPLTSILGAALTLSQQGDGISRESQKVLLDMIAEESRRLNNMITSILDVSRIESGRALDLCVSKASMATTIESVVRMQRAGLQAHELVVALPPDLPEVEMDAGKIQRVLINLIDNAVKYSPNGGQVRISASSDGHTLSVSVEDQGLGIAEEDLPHVFERFRRVGGKLSRQSVGSGLGLYLAKGIVEAHGGTIEVSSMVGRGSTFTFTIPLRQPSSA